MKRKPKPRPHSRVDPWLDQLTPEQQQVCARCGRIRWFHEPGRVHVPDHEFMLVWKPWEGKGLAC
jgi:hypothetical protein